MVSNSQNEASAEGGQKKVNQAGAATPNKAAFISDSLAIVKKNSLELRCIRGLGAEIRSKRATFRAPQRNIRWGCFVYTSAVEQQNDIGPSGQEAKTPRWQPRGVDTHLSGR